LETGFWDLADVVRNDVVPAPHVNSVTVRVHVSPPLRDAHRGQNHVFEKLTLRKEKTVLPPGKIKTLFPAFGFSLLERNEFETKQSPLNHATFNAQRTQRSPDHR
jgi:hypothetical protein